MTEDFNTAPEDDLITADICIVGAGAAGITLARSFLNTDCRVLLVESGGADYDKQTQDLYKGDLTGEDYYDLRESRLRFFGGSTAIWGGRCAQLDNIDFEKRPWVEHSGWPIGKSEMAPWYEKAQQELELDTVADNSLPGHVNPFRDGRLTTAFWQFDEKFSRFTLPSCQDLRDADNIRILLHANAICIQTSENGAQVTGLDIASLQGRNATVKAEHYVLAMGGLEIPRLMLASKTRAHPDGIGNRHDQVGRFFMEHPHGRGARVECPDPGRLFRLFPAYVRHNRKRYGMLMRPTEACQRDTQILNTAFTIGVFKHPGQTPEFYRRAYGKIKHDMAPSVVGRSLWRVVKRASRWAQDNFGPEMLARSLKKPQYGIYTVIRAEQAPNPDSRLCLSDKKDALGMPLPDLNWQFLDIDKRSVLRAMQALDTELQSLKLGRADPAQWVSDHETTWEFDHIVTNHDKGGYHHMGTTRMGTDPKVSVVDSDCRVHGMGNLYIAGSSVFPTGGWANPTLTILALAMRLGDHIRQKQKSVGVSAATPPSK